jgi:hypothetical protein
MNEDELRARLQRIEETVGVRGRATVKHGLNRLATSAALAAAVLAGVGVTMLVLMIVNAEPMRPLGAASPSTATAASSAEASAESNPVGSPTGTPGCSPGASQEVPPWWPEEIEPEIVMVHYTTDNPDERWLERVTEIWGLEEYSHSAGTGWFRYHITDGESVLDKVLFLQGQPEVESALPVGVGGGWLIYPTVTPEPTPATGC